MGFDEATIQKFWSKVERGAADKCWHWTAGLTKWGYGQTTIAYKSYRAHRLAWAFHNGQPVPDGMSVCHSCDNPACCNPHHLWIGTIKDNTLDMVKKGRGNRQAVPVASVPGIYARLKAGESAAAIAKEFNVHPSTIRDIRSHKTYRWLTIDAEPEKPKPDMEIVRYVEAADRNEQHLRHSHLYAETAAGDYWPMCVYGWNRSNGESYSILRGNGSWRGMCKLCLRNKEAGKPPVTESAPHPTKWI